MHKRVLLGLLIAILIPAIRAAQAQQAAKVYRIGYLMGGFPSGTNRLLKAFKQGLVELGYAEGKNFVVDARWTERNPGHLPALAADLVRLDVDVIIAAPTAEALAAQHATRKIPIVVAHMSDPVEAGLVASLARPGGNVTGSRSLQAELGGKRLELLKDAFPQVTRVAVIGGSDNPGSRRQFREMERAARGLGLELRRLELKSRDPDFDNLFRSIVELKADAFTLNSGLSQLDFLRQLSDLTTKIRLPSIYPNRTYAEAGGVLSYGIKWEEFHRRAAYYVDKILKGAKPGELPVEQLTAVEFVVNLRTAKALNFVIPPQMLMDADEVIR